MNFSRLRADQEFRIIQIKKSINTYNSHCNSNRGNQLVKSPSNALAVQAEERAKRTITLLEKKKALELEMEKESVHQRSN